ncbi:MAG TPA: HD domain-containing phosphohydrolase [Gaiellaceae bacterium]|nr:HD domain-containing phosphohydrolase [Gaiellaceae bacterium]
MVEDDEHVGRLLSSMLEGHGYSCAVSADATQAGRLLDELDPELVLCDVNLPGASGLDLVRHATAAHPDTAVVMVSGLDDPRIAENALTLGAYGYIIKPFTPNELLIGVANALRRRNLEIESRARHEELEEIVRLRTAALRASHEETIRRLAAAAEFRDEATGRHIGRMSRICEVLAAKAGLGRERCELLRIASPLHDVGKIGIPDRILLKPGSLTQAEWKVMRTHTEIGRDLLSGSGAELLDAAALIAWTHHEKVDGSGYPRGLAGEAIPLEGRIAAVADVFDALTADRVYRAALPVDEALATMHDGRGSHFDAELLDLFLASVDDIAAVRPEAPSARGVSVAR